MSPSGQEKYSRTGEASLSNFIWKPTSLPITCGSFIYLLAKCQDDRINNILMNFTLSLSHSVGFNEIRLYENSKYFGPILIYFISLSLQ